jgi:REP element-mobilizing transposase RayT
MPDHLHVLVEIPATTTLQKFVRIFKQMSGFRIKAKTGGTV